MKNLGIIFRRELSSYFATPLAYIFVVIFLIINGILEILSLQCNSNRLIPTLILVSMLHV